MLTEEQRVFRRKGIGGSDAGVLLGLNPWKNLHQLWEEKALGKSSSAPWSEAILWGNLLEPVILKEYISRKKKDGLVLEVEPFWLKNSMVKHTTYDFLVANPDALLVDPSGFMKGLEIKTTSYTQRDKWGPEFSRTIPAHYYAQVVHYMLVTGLSSWDVAVLIGGNDFRIYNFPRDMDMENEIVKKGTIFWNENVLKKIPPAEGT